MQVKIFNIQDVTIGSTVDDRVVKNLLRVGAPRSGPTSPPKHIGDIRHRIEHPVRRR